MLVHEMHDQELDFLFHFVIVHIDGELKRLFQ